MVIHLKESSLGKGRAQRTQLHHTWTAKEFCQSRVYKYTHEIAEQYAQYRCCEADLQIRRLKDALRDVRHELVMNGYPLDDKTIVLIEEAVAE